MSVTNQHTMGASNLPEWIQKNPIMILSLTFLIGLLLGISGNTLMTQQGSMKELAAIRAELYKSGRTINRLAGYESTVDRTNSLLGSLCDQQRSIAVAANELRKISDINQQLHLVEGQMDETGARASNMASLLSTINEQTDLVGNQAESALATLQDMQVIAIDQQFAIPELQNALEAQQAINSRIATLGDGQDIAERSLQAIAENQDRIQDLATGFEETFAQVDQVAELMDRQDEIEISMRDFDYVLNSAKWLAADAREVQNILTENRASHREALSNLDELVWMSEYLGMQGDSLTQAQQSLTKIDQIQGEASRLESALGELIDVVELVTGVNAALSSVSETAVQIRQDLAEIVLLQPAVRQIYSGIQNEVRESSSPKVVDAKERARALIHASRSQETEHKEILTSH